MSGRLDGRMIEYVDHLHEHFVDPVVVIDGRYRAPLAPGYSAEMKPASLRRHTFATGEVWREAERIEPKPLTNRGRLVIAVAAAVILAVGNMLGRYDAALIGLGLGAAESTLRPAYHRRLVDRIRAIGH